MNNTINRAILFLMLFTFFITSASAFDLYANQKDIEVCSCGTHITSLTIYNNENYVSMFNLESSGSGADFLQSPRSSFVLAPGAKKELQEIFSVPCDVTGKFYVSFKVSANGNTKTINQNINVVRCNSIKVFVKNNSQTIEPCKKAHFEILLENPANYAETYFFKVPKYSQFTNSFLSLSLNPNQKAILNLDYQFPCSYHGNFELPFDIYAQKTGIKLRVPLNLTIKSDYKYDVKVKLSSEQCAESKGVYNITIKNNFYNPNNFSLKLDGPGFIGLDKNFINLYPGEEKTFNVIVDPRKNQLIGTFNSSLIIEDLTGHTKKTIPFKIKINDCYSLNLTLNKTEDSLCLYNKSYNLNIKNLGHSGHLNIYLDKDYDFLSLSNTDFDLSENDVRNVNIKVNTLKAKPGKYKIKFIAVLKTGSIEVVTDKTLELNIEPKDTCYSLDTYITKSWFEGKDNFTLALKNTGFYPLDLTLFSENNLFSLRRNKILVPPKEKRYILVTFSPNTSGTYDFKILAKSQTKDFTETFTIHNNKEGTLRNHIFTLFLIAILLSAILSFKRRKLKINYLIVSSILVFFVLLSFIINLFYAVYFAYIFSLVGAVLFFLLCYNIFFKLKTVFKKTVVSKVKKINKKKLLIKFKTLFYIILLIFLSVIIIIKPLYLDLILKLILLLLFLIAVFKIIKIIKLKLAISKLSPKEKKEEKKISLGLKSSKTVKSTKKKQKKNKPKKKTKKFCIKDIFSKILDALTDKIKKINPFRSLLFLVIIMTLFLLAITLKVNTTITSPLNDTFLNQKVFINEPKYLELNNYFKDPDNDTLYYNFTTTNNLIVPILLNGDVLKVIPLVPGNDSLYIVADDLRGGIIKSPEIKYTIYKSRLSPLEVLISSTIIGFGFLNTLLIYLIIMLVSIILIKNSYKHNK